MLLSIRYLRLRTWVLFCELRDGIGVAQEPPEAVIVASNVTPTATAAGVPGGLGTGSEGNLYGGLPAVGWAESSRVV